MMTKKATNKNKEGAAQAHTDPLYIAHQVHTLALLTMQHLAGSAPAAGACAGNPTQPTAGQPGPAWPGPQAATPFHGVQTAPLVYWYA